MLIHVVPVDRFCQDFDISYPMLSCNRLYVCINMIQCDYVICLDTQICVLNSSQFIPIHLNSSEFIPIRQSVACSVQVFRPAFGLHTRDSPLWDKAENRDTSQISAREQPRKQPREQPSAQRCAKSTLIQLVLSRTQPWRKARLFWRLRSTRSIYAREIAVADSIAYGFFGLLPLNKCTGLCLSSEMRWNATL